MVQLSQLEFERILSAAIDVIPPKYLEHLENVAFILEDEPSQAQLIKLNLYPNETLFGLYEGVPLPRRGGATKLLPDKITLFKGPLERTSRDLAELQEKVRHTVWHEVAHYFGLDHQRIHELENKIRPNTED